jgi:hypothetical protein
VFSDKIFLWIGILFAVLFGVFAGAVDLTSKEVQGTVLLIIVSAGALGFLIPKRAWIWALIIGASIFGAHLWAQSTGYPVPYPVEPNVAITLLALIPAFIGAYSGVGARWVMQRIATQH